MADKLSAWFAQNSGYAVHPLRAKPLAGCCVAGAAADGRVVWLPAAQAEELPCPLFVCAFCGNCYAQQADGFVPLENLLRFRITTK